MQCVQSAAVRGRPHAVATCRARRAVQLLPGSVAPQVPCCSSGRQTVAAGRGSRVPTVMQTSTGHQGPSRTLGQGQVRGICAGPLLLMDDGGILRPSWTSVTLLARTPVPVQPSWQQQGLYSAVRLIPARPALGGAGWHGSRGTRVDAALPSRLRPPLRQEVMQASPPPSSASNVPRLLPPLYHTHTHHVVTLGAHAAAAGRLLRHTLASEPPRPAVAPPPPPRAPPTAKATTTAGAQGLLPVSRESAPTTAAAAGAAWLPAPPLSCRRR